MTDLIVIRKSKLSQSPNQKDDIYQEINEKPGFRVFFFFFYMKDFIVPPPQLTAGPGESSKRSRNREE